MKIGVCFDLRNAQPWVQPYPKFYSEAIEHMQALDAMGFASINITEHHFAADGYCPSPIVWNAAMAVKTKRAMLGQYVMLMPFVHPVKLAEDIATVDILSNGRAWIQAGEAYRPHEFEAFGIDRKRQKAKVRDHYRCWFFRTSRRIFFEKEGSSCNNIGSEKPDRGQGLFIQAKNNQ